MCPMVPTFTCGLLRSNFSLAMSFTSSLITQSVRHALGPPPQGAFDHRGASTWVVHPPSPGSATVARANVGKREPGCPPPRLRRSTSGRPPSRCALRWTTFAWLANRSSRERWQTRAKVGADDQDRTGDLVLTKDALCQLSYIGLRAPRHGPTSRLPRSALRPDTSSSALRATARHVVFRALRQGRQVGPIVHDFG